MSAHPRHIIFDFVLWARAGQAGTFLHQRRQDKRTFSAAQMLPLRLLCILTDYYSRLSIYLTRLKAPATSVKFLAKSDQSYDQQAYALTRPSRRPTCVMGRLPPSKSFGFGLIRYLLYSRNSWGVQGSAAFMVAHPQNV